MDNSETKYRVNEQGMIVEEICGSEASDLDVPPAKPDGLVKSQDMDGRAFVRPARVMHRS